MWEAVIFAATGAALWILFDGMRAREHAVALAKDACREQNLQFLDDTVRRVRTRLGRDADGRARWRRTFVFEFSEDGHQRRGGSAVMLGNTLESLQLEAYRMDAEPVRLQ